MSNQPGNLSHVRVTVKALVGVVMPLALVASGAEMLYRTQHDFGPTGAVSWKIFAAGIPVLLVINSLLMIPRWQKVRTVLLTGLVVPGIFLIAGWCLLH